jgi:predicted RNA-binding Zn-ribbon protein involved in translation (DUF1610 family)
MQNAVLADKAVIAAAKLAERQAREAMGPLDNGWLGIDVGWVFPAADSDGRVYRWSGSRDKLIVPQAGPVTIRKLNGAVFTREAYSPRGAAEVWARSTHDVPVVAHLAKQIVATAERSKRGLALENWGGFSRRKPAWVRVWAAIRDRATDRHVPITTVNRAYTSITCPRCGVKSRANRISRDRFECQTCGLAGQADVIAAINIAAKAANRFQLTLPECEAEGCDGFVWKAGACSRCYHFRYRVGRLPSAAEIQARKEAPDLRQYRTEMRKKALLEREERSNAAIQERLAESYRTHDAWGNPIAPAGEGA